MKWEDPFWLHSLSVLTLYRSLIFLSLDLVYDIEQAVCEFPDIANRTGCSGKFTIVYFQML